MIFGEQVTRRDPARRPHAPRFSPAHARLITLPVENPAMPDVFTVQHREVGMPRIYLKRSDKIGSRRFWGAKPLYRELICS